MQALKGKLTYANVIATMALFLALSGGVAWAAHKIGANQLKSNSVGTGKIKKNAVTATKIKKSAITNTKLANGAVSNAKLADGAVNFAKLATGTNVIASATSAPVNVNSVNTAIPVPLTGTTTFTPQAGVVDLLNIEARGINLGLEPGKTACSPTVQPLINGQLFEISSGFLNVSSETNPKSEFSPVPVDSETGPVGLAQPGVPQQITMRVLGDKECTAASQISVALVVTQLK
jgi:hypothetical protein